MATRSRDHGASTIELAILWPVIAAMLFGAIQIACYFTARTVALTAAQAAVTAERQFDAEPAAGIRHAEKILEESGDWLQDASVEGAHPSHHDGVTYTVTGTALSLVPWLATWQISQTAHGTQEQFTEVTP